VDHGRQAARRLDRAGLPLLAARSEASIVQGHTNKYHDGFLGHSYLGSWVNLAAGTQNQRPAQ